MHMHNSTYTEYHSMIPFTSTFFLQNNEVSGEQETISHEPLENIRDLVCRTAGVKNSSEGRGMYYSLNQLITWKDKMGRGNDPITRRPLKWNDYEAVMLNVVESLGEKIHRFNAYCATEMRLQGLQGQDSRLLPRHSTLTINLKHLKYQAFRYLMKQLVDARPLRSDLTWLYDYWLYYPYDPSKDHPDIELIERDLGVLEGYNTASNKEEFIRQIHTIITTPGYNRDVVELYKILTSFHTEAAVGPSAYQEFRLRMKEIAENPPNARIELLMHDYWRYYPYDPARDDPSVEYIELNPVYVDLYRGHGMVTFRTNMCSQIVETAFLDSIPGYDELLHMFWRYHPVGSDPYDSSSCIPDLYTETANTYNRTHPDSEPYAIPPY